MAEILCKVNLKFLEKNENSIKILLYTYHARKLINMWYVNQLGYFVLFFNVLLKLKTILNLKSLHWKQSIKFILILFV